MFVVGFGSDEGGGEVLEAEGPLCSVLLEIAGVYSIYNSKIIDSTAAICIAIAQVVAVNHAICYSFVLGLACLPITLQLRMIQRQIASWLPHDE